MVRLTNSNGPTSSAVACPSAASRTISTVPSKRPSRSATPLRRKTCPDMNGRLLAAEPSERRIPTANFEHLEAEGQRLLPERLKTMLKALARSNLLRDDVL